MELNLQERDAILALLWLLRTSMNDGQAAATEGAAGELLTNGHKHSGLTSWEAEKLADKICDMYPTPRLG